MIISCPACGTRYVVPETAIGADGRTVRCAKCKHSWLQEPKPLDLTKRADADPHKSGAAKPVQSRPAPAPTPAPTPPAPPAQSAAGEVAAPSIDRWHSEDRPEGADGRPTAAPDGASPSPPAPPPEPEAPISDAFDPDADPLSRNDDEADYEDEEYGFDDNYDDRERSRFDYSPPFSRRRNSLKMWTLAAAIFALLASGTALAVNYYGLPNWFPVSRPTFGIGKADLELDFPAAQQRSETLESGEEIFRVRGTIRNTGQASVGVPNLLIVFRDEREKNVYSWIVVPSKGELAPGENLIVTEAVTNIPATAKAAEIGWSPN